jgi:hypothetical protein
MVGSKTTAPQTASSIPASPGDNFQMLVGIVPATYLGQTMKTKTILGFALVAFAFATSLVPRSSLGQAGSDDALLSPLVEEIARQQATIVENQVQIDAKIAVIAENIRLARIFVSRGGGSSGGNAQPK